MNADLSNYAHSLRKDLNIDMDLFSGNYICNPTLMKSDFKTPGSVHRSVSNFTSSVQKNFDIKDKIFASSTNWCHSYQDVRFDCTELVVHYCHQNRIPFVMNLVKVFRKGNGEVGVCIASEDGKHPPGDDLVLAD